MKSLWVFIALVAAVMIYYALNRGLYFGSGVEKQDLSPWVLYRVNCLYLFPTGVTTIYGESRDTREKAENDLCTFFLR